MDKTAFQQLLTKEVQTYKSFLETQTGDWIVKGFIDVNRNIYSIGDDTKVISKLIELTLIPRLKAFAREIGLELELPTAQNYYPDLTFKDGEGNLFAVDFKSSYYDDSGKVNGLTLGSYWGYFRSRDVKKSTDYPYNDYKCHLVIGMLYKKNEMAKDQKDMFTLDELTAIRSVIKSFVFFVQPKWKIASDKPGSGNTRNIGGINTVADLTAGNGVFAKYGEDVFDDYWMNYFNANDAKQAGLETPYYNSLETYKAYRMQQEKLLQKLK